MRPETVGIFACLGGYAISGNAPVAPQTGSGPLSLRPNVPLGSAAAKWRAKRLLEEAQMDWQEAQKITAQAPDDKWEEWNIAHRASSDFIEDFVDPDSLGFAPPLAQYDVVLELQSDDSPWPALSLDDVDLELFDLR